MRFALQSDRDYEYAVVGVPSGRYRWILSRTPIVPEDRYRAILDRLAAKGVDLTRLLKTPPRDTETTAKHQRNWRPLAVGIEGPALGCEVGTGVGPREG
jgi:hypothetical protein